MYHLSYNAYDRGNLMYCGHCRGYNSKMLIISYWRCHIINETAVICFVELFLKEFRCYSEMTRLQEFYVVNLSMRHFGVHELWPFESLERI